MDGSIDFLLERSGYTVKQLTPENATVLQNLYERCADFLFLTDGLPPSPTAALEAFADVPEGKTTRDLYVFGLFAPGDSIVGTISAVRCYPDDRTWWIGLMVIAPDRRRQGLGSEFYRGFERWVLERGASYISLVVIEANEPGFRFWKKMGFEVVRKTPPRQYGVKIHEVYVLRRTLN